MADSNKKKVGVTLDPALHAAVKSVAAKRMMTTEAAYDAALRDWLGDSAIQRSPLGTILQPQYAKLLHDLGEVLADADEPVRDMLLGTIKAQIHSYKTHKPRAHKIHATTK